MELAEQIMQELKNARLLLIPGDEEMEQGAAIITRHLIAPEGVQEGCKCACHDDPKHMTVQDWAEANRYHVAKLKDVTAERDALQAALVTESASPTVESVLVELREMFPGKYVYVDGSISGSFIPKKKKPSVGWHFEIQVDDKSTGVILNESGPTLAEALQQVRGAKEKEK